MEATQAAPDGHHEAADVADRPAWLPADLTPAPRNQPPEAVRAWFDAAAAAAIPEHDGTIGTARRAALAYAHRAKAANTRLAYRAGVRAWCTWCDQHALPCLPARAADVVAFLAAEHGRGAGVATVDLRRAAIRYLHFIAGCPVPTAEAHVAETMAGIHRTAADQGDLPAKKLAATVDILRQILAPIGDDLAGLRDRALLLVGFAGALRRAELAAIRVEHLEAARARPAPDPATLQGRPHRQRRHRRHPLRRHRALPGARAAPLAGRRRHHRGRGVPPHLAAADPPQAGRGPPPCPVVGSAAIDAGTVARIVKARAAAAGFDPRALGGHSLKRGALTTGMDRGVHPTRLKQLGRHKSYAVLDEYLELGDPFDSHPLSGVL